MRKAISDGHAAMAFSFALNLSFFETVAYYTLLNRTTGGLPAEFVSTLFAVGLLAWLLLSLSFIGAPEALKQPLVALYRRAEWARVQLGNSLGLLLFVIPTLFVSVFALDLLPEALKGLFWDKVTEVGFLIGLWVAVTLLAWYVSQLLNALRHGPLKDLGAVLDDWSLGTRLSVAHFCVVATFGWYAVAPWTLPRRQRVAFTFAFTKDVFLLWIIALLLFASLFKLGHHKVLLRVFQNVRGYLQFVVVCGIIAILAVWADFRTIGSEPMRQMFPEDWKQELIQAHVYTRDLGLLLAPIAALLVWTLNRVAEEMEPK